jgi:hypothetical protein
MTPAQKYEVIEASSISNIGKKQETKLVFPIAFALTLVINTLITC